MLLKAGRKFTSSNLRNFPSSSTTQTCCSISLLTFDWCSVSITWNENVIWNEQHIVRFKDKNSPRSFRQLELQQVLWESAWEGQLRLSSKNLERQIFTSQVPPSPWGKLRRTWRSVGQVGNCLARASPWLDNWQFPQKIFCEFQLAPEVQNPYQTFYQPRPGSSWLSGEGWLPRSKAGELNVGFKSWTSSSFKALFSHSSSSLAASRIMIGEPFSWNINVSESKQANWLHRRFCRWCRVDLYVVTAILMIIGSVLSVLSNPIY